ncbi:MAG: TlyA family RNA methyltransferase [Kiritimatiellae bacterium]|nr:TlyA family RNA methyltransferase [Kiritimatiellia bacterium]
MKKERLDTLLVEAGLADSKELAQRLILAGAVRVSGQVAAKCGHRYANDLPLEVTARPRFVSRGGDKMQGAFTAFPDFDVTGLVGLDVGASTGGFTDCLLQHGALRMIAVDVGRGQLHWKLRQDQRVHVMESFNARYLRLEDLPEQPQVAVTDVSFISLKLILPPMAAVLEAGREIISLIKPQFEAGRKQAPRGVVRDPAVHQAVVEEIRRFGTEELRLEWLGCVESPLRGPEGNVEFLARWRKGYS